MFTHMHVHAKTHTYTHTYLIRETGPPCPLSLLECAQNWRNWTRLWKRLCKKKKTFLPSLVFLTFCHPPSPSLPLLLHCWFFPPPYPTAGTPFCSLRHGPAHPTPHSGASFSTHTSDVSCSDCEGLFPSVSSTLSPFQLKPLCFLHI